jgi:hypothetical protein
LFRGGSPTAQLPKDKSPVNGSSQHAAELFAALAAEEDEDKEDAP